nr:hypothetical protein [Haloglycomyces albus]
MEGVEGENGAGQIKGLEEWYKSGRFVGFCPDIVLGVGDPVVVGDQGQKVAALVASGGGTSEAFAIQGLRGQEVSCAERRRGVVLVDVLVQGDLVAVDQPLAYGLIQGVGVDAGEDGGDASARG